MLVVAGNENSQRFNVFVWIIYFQYLFSFSIFTVFLSFCSSSLANIALSLRCSARSRIFGIDSFHRGCCCDCIGGIRGRRVARSTMSGRSLEVSKTEAGTRLSGEIDGDHFIILNVGGEMITTSRQTLTLDSNSVLGRMFSQDALSSTRDKSGAVLIDRVCNATQHNGHCLSMQPILAPTAQRILVDCVCGIVVMAMFACLGSSILSCVVELFTIWQVDLG
jgi:hypothetical protein